MQGFYITGRNGSYIELEDGRWADSVSEDPESENGNVDELLDELTDAADYPIFTDLLVEQLREYVGVE